MREVDLFMQTFLSRRDDFALQRPDGGYVRAGRPLTAHVAYEHLLGTHTIGSYLIDEQGHCSYGVFDADSDNGLHILRGVQATFTMKDIPSYLEQSRRGGHLWVFLARPVLASHLRAWLLPCCPTDVECYPKQDESRGYGSLMRLPFGRHMRSGKRYPFVTWTGSEYRPIADTLKASLQWLASIERVTRIPEPPVIPTNERNPPTQEKSFSHPAATTIRAWCAQQDPFAFIGRYVTLDARGVGCCPFGWHHKSGCDRHASFKVYAPGVPGGYCWYCHVWQQGGSVFDFLRHYYRLDARTLWHRLQTGEVKVC